MVVVPLAKSANDPTAIAPVQDAQNANWIRYAAAGTLAVSGALLITGRRRAGLIAAASGVALAILDQREVVAAWWDALPSFLEELHGTLGRAETTVEELSAQGQRLREILQK
jgi:hypothetical protein